MNTFGLNSRGIDTFGLLLGEGEIILPGPTPIPDPGGRGSGPTGGIEPGVYRDQYRDDLEETRRKKILEEDNDIIALIVSMTTKGLM